MSSLSNITKELNNSQFISTWQIPFRIAIILLHFCADLSRFVENIILMAGDH